MQGRDFPEFSQDCEKVIEELRCLKEKISTVKGQQLLEDLVDQVAETKGMVEQAMAVIMVGAMLMSSWMGDLRMAIAV